MNDINKNKNDINFNVKKVANISPPKSDSKNSKALSNQKFGYMSNKRKNG